MYIYRNFLFQPKALVVSSESIISNPHFRSPKDIEKTKKESTADWLEAERLRKEYSSQREDTPQKFGRISTNQVVFLVNFTT